MKRIGNDVCGDEMSVGWVERSEPHHRDFVTVLVGLAPLDPPYHSRVALNRRCIVTGAALFGLYFFGGGVAWSQDGPAAGVPVREVSISNLKPRRDVEGKIIDAHDGCLHKFGDRYYLYGTAYGKTDGFGKTNRYRCYSSPDLVSWKLEGNLLPQQTAGDLLPALRRLQRQNTEIRVVVQLVQEDVGRAVRRGHQRSSAGTVYGPE